MEKKSDFYGTNRGKNTELGKSEHNQAGSRGGYREKVAEGTCLVGAVS